MTTTAPQAMFGESFVEHGMERRPSVQVLEWSTKKVYKDASAPMFEAAVLNLALIHQTSANKPWRHELTE